MGDPTTILQADYKSLPISPSFKRFFTMYKISTLEVLLERTPKELLKMTGFNERTLKELIDLMEANELLHLLDRN